jgi:hypothetical protein
MAFCAVIAEKITPDGVTTNQAHRPGLNARRSRRLRMSETLHGHFFRGELSSTLTIADALDRNETIDSI